MAISTAEITVTNAATLLSTPETDDSSGSSIALKNTGSVTCYYGNASVTSGTAATKGFPLVAGESVSVDLKRADTLYAITASGTTTVAVFRQGV